MSLRTLAALALSLLWTGSLRAQGELRPGPPQRFELPSESSLRLVYRAGIDGEASVRARAQGRRLEVEVLDARGSAVRFGAGPPEKGAPCVFDVSPGTPFTIVLKEGPGPEDAAEGLEVEVSVVESAVDASLAELTERFADLLERMRRAHEARDFAAVRRLGREALETLEKLPIRKGRHRTWRTVQDLGYEAYRIEDDEVARAIWGRVLERYERTLLPDNEELLLLRANQAVLLGSGGAREEARRLFDSVLAIWRTTRREDDRLLLWAERSQADLLAELGDLSEAEAIYRRVLRIEERDEQDADLSLAATRVNLANILRTLGDDRAALDLYARARASAERVLADDALALQTYRMNHAAALERAGRPEEARAIYEGVLAVLERLLPEAHPSLLFAQSNLGILLSSLGDHHSAEVLLTRVLRVQERVLPGDDLGLQRTRLAYARALCEREEHAGAVALARKAAEVLERRLPAEHPDLQRAWSRLATALDGVGEHEKALALRREVAAVRGRTRPAADPGVLRARAAVATSLGTMGRYEEALALQEELLEDLTASGFDDPLLLDSLEAGWLHSLASLRALGLADPDDRIDALLARRLERARTEIEGMLGSRTDREIGLRVVTLEGELVRALSLGSAPARAAGLDRAVLRLAEALRSAPVRARRLAGAVEAAPAELRAEAEAARSRLARRRREVDRFIAAPHPEPEGEEARTAVQRLGDLVLKRDEAERELLALLRRGRGATRLTRPLDLESIASALPEGTAAVSFLHHPTWEVSRSEGRSVAEWRDGEAVTAFVLDPGGGLRTVELGPYAPIDRAAGLWRRAIGGGDDVRGIEVERRGPLGDPDGCGRALRRLVLDPILEVLDEKVERLVVAHTHAFEHFALDALPDERGGVVGDHLEIAITPGLEWIVRASPRPRGEPRLLACGGIDYSASAAAGATGDPERARPYWSQSLSPLPFTRVEVERIAELHGEAFEPSEDEEPLAVLLTGGEATRARFRELAPRARFLHLATHGWFAPSEVSAIADQVAGDAGIGVRGLDLVDHVIGYEPLALCGLALSGANLTPTRLGAHPGLLGGAEIASLDLRGVELAVLSACDTQVGSRPSGQSLMSLQQALLSAGVERTVSALWSVPDRPTMELMTRFYEGIWRRGEGEREALWNAKRALREAKDESGAPRHGPRDWAGWILVGP